MTRHFWLRSRHSIPIDLPLPLSSPKLINSANVYRHLLYLFSNFLKSYDLVYQNIAYRRVFTNVLRVHDRLPEGLFLSETQAAQDAIWTAQRNHITSKITNDSVNSFSEWMILKYAGSRTKRWSFYFHAIETEWKIYIQWPTVAYFRARQKIRPDTEILESFMELEKSAAPVFILEIGRSADWLLTYHISATTR